MQGTRLPQNPLPGLFRVFKPRILFQAPPLPGLQFHPSESAATFWNQSLGHFGYPPLGPPPPPVHVPSLGFCDLPSMVSSVDLRPSAAASMQSLLSQNSEKLQLEATPFKKPVNNSGGRNSSAVLTAKARKKKFPCPLCDIRCSNNGQLQGHMRIHTGERPFSCSFEGCERRFARNEELTRHRRIHTGVRPHKCDVCNKAFGRKDHLSKHQKTHLQAAEKKIFMCAVLGCGQKYSRSDALTRHQYTAHSLIKTSSRPAPRRAQDNAVIPASCLRAASSALA